MYGAHGQSSSGENYSIKNILSFAAASHSQAKRRQGYPGAWSGEEATGSAVAAVSTDLAEQVGALNTKSKCF